MGHRLALFATSILLVAAVLAGCRMNEGGGQGSEAASPSTAAEASQGGTSAETPGETMSNGPHGY